MKKFIALAALLLVGCDRHFATSEVKEIGPNETAFLIALEGDTINNQDKLNSYAALQKAQQGVAVKRITIPHKLIDLCPSAPTHEECHYKDVPTAKLVVVNRSLVTREWTATATKGTSKSNQAISVETNESIDFDLGTIITAHINEADAAKFLYTFGGRTLGEVLDSDVRSVISASLSKSFGTHSLDDCRAHKIDYYVKAEREATEFFADKGVTIDKMALTEGMNYHDQSIQASINKHFAASQERAAASDQAAAANTLMANKEGFLMQQEMKLRGMALENQAEWIKKWNGVAPSTVAGSDTSMMVGLP